MKTLFNNNTQILTVPGLNGSGQKHWQTIWETNYDNVSRIEQQSWNVPSRDAWVTSIEKHVSETTNKEIFLVAHSLGTIAVAHWALKTKLRISGALLVAPPWLDSVHLHGIVQSFNPAPVQKLPFKTIVVASANDQYASIAQSQFWAQAWGSQLVNVGERGHINAESNVNEWLEGIDLLHQLKTPKYV